MEGAPEAQHGPFIDEPVLSELFSGYGRAYLTPSQRAVLKVPRGNRQRPDLLMLPFLIPPSPDL